jgi:hypothetical protein
MESKKKDSERGFFAGLLTKQKGKKRWKWFDLGVVLFLAWICFMLGGQIACESGGGILLGDMRCVNTSNLDLCIVNGHIMRIETNIPVDFETWAENVTFNKTRVGEWNEQ